MTIRLAGSPSADPNTLDWYEEGSWVPTIYGGTTAGATTYTQQTGKFTRIGRMVHFSCRVAWSAQSGTGAINIGGLPYAIGATEIGACAVMCGGLTFTGVPQGYLSSGLTAISLWHGQSNVTFTQIPMDAAADVIVSGSYSI